MVTFKGLSTLLFGNVVDKYSQLFLIVKTSLPKADIKIPFRAYVSMVLFSSLLAYIISFIAIFTTLLIFTKTSLIMVLVYSIFSPFMIALICFAVLTFYPIQKTTSRGRSIDTNLPFVLTHMGAVAESGVPPYIIFKLISEFEEYGEVSVEMKKIVRNIDVFGLDPLTAVKEVANRTPSKGLKQILNGFVTTTESGGDIKKFLKLSGEQSLFEWRMKREKFLQQLSAYAEFYTGLLIAAPLFIIALFAVMNMIQPTIVGYDILFLTQLSIYVIVPLLNIAFLMFLRGVEVEM